VVVFLRGCGQKNFLFIPPFIALATPLIIGLYSCKNFPKIARKINMETRNIIFGSQLYSDTIGRGWGAHLGKVWANFSVGWTHSSNLLRKAKGDRVTSMVA